MEILRTTNSLKELGSLRQLKDPQKLSKIDLKNEYHLPQIIRSIEMIEEEKKVCNELALKHKLKTNQPRSRHLSRRPPLRCMSPHVKNTAKVEVKKCKTLIKPLFVINLANTRQEFFSPQRNREESKKIYNQKLETIIVGGLYGPNKPKKSPNKSKSRMITRDENTDSMLDSQHKGAAKPEPQYAEDKVADNFMIYIKGKVGSKSLYSTMS